MKPKKCTDLELQRRVQLFAVLIVSLIAIAILQNLIKV